MLDTRHEPFQIVLAQIVVRPRFHQRYGRVFANESGHDDERQVEAALLQEVQGLVRAELRQRAIGEHQIPRLAGKRGAHGVRCLGSLVMRIEATAA